MSVINQLLLDLEKRRASPTERSALPTHVRALPEAERPSNWGWLAAGGAVVAAVLGISWTVLSGFDWTRQRAAAAPQISAPGAANAAEKAVTAPAGIAANAGKTDAAEDAGRDGPASRLTFELSAVPARIAEPPATEAALIPAGRVLAPAREEASAKSEPSAPSSATGQRPVAAPRTALTAPPAKAEIRKHVRQPTVRELADSEYGKATTLLHQGRLAEAQEGFHAALSHHPAHHGARQALVGLLLESRSWSEAERVLQDGLVLAPAQTGFAMTLARLQVDRGDNAQAIATLQKGLDHARSSADYLGFLAALLQRQSRHEDAIAQYQSALRLKPSAGVWWVGLGISLQAANRPAEAQDAYRRARATNSLNGELAAFAEQRLKQLQ
jgi:MSHA biogenesis protein MshN